MKILEAEHLCKSFGQTKVLKDISFSLEEVRYCPSLVLPEVENHASALPEFPGTAGQWYDPRQGQNCL